jgi:hypothetical protein
MGAAGACRQRSATRNRAPMARRQSEPLPLLAQKNTSRAHQAPLAFPWHSLSKAPNRVLGAFRMVSGIDGADYAARV